MTNIILPKKPLLIAPGTVLERRIVASDANQILEWRRVQQDDGLDAWKPFRMDVRTGKVIDEPIWAPLPGSQWLFLECPVFETLYCGTRGNGKGLPISEPVYTNTGPRSIGDLKIGDWVSHPSGTITKVIGVYPQGKRPCYELEFDDGAIARCDDQHIWPIHVQGLRDKRNLDYRLYTMPQILRIFKETEQRLHIPTIDRVHMTRHMRLKEWPVDPYLLGLLLGDGSLVETGVSYCTVDSELAEVVLQSGLNEVSSDKRNINIRKFGLSRKSPVYKGLQKLKLIGKRSWEKSVPDWYKYSSSEDRLSILQGIMDTDGTSDAMGHIYFGSCSKQLAKDVQYLVRSLGGKATLTRNESRLNGERMRDSFDVYIQCGGKFNPFKLARKKNRVIGYQYDTLWRRIVKITEMPAQETVCIKVDHPDGLFITRDFVVTHNTINLIMDFVREVGKGFGSSWRGILFRREYKDLDDVVKKIDEWMPKLFGTKFRMLHSKSEYRAEWDTGEALLLRHLESVADYPNYHGHEYPWLGFEELTQWEDLDAYLKMQSCCRSTQRGIPCRVRATTNPYGPGHNNVKKRFQIPQKMGKVVSVPGEMPRVAINGSVYENFLLTHAQPNYLTILSQSTKNPAERKAWIEGDWNVTSGGMIDDLWRPEIHVIPTFGIGLVPDGWTVTRAYDHGQSHPFAVGWWLESNGEPLEIDGRIVGSVRGDLVLWMEWYGTSGEVNTGIRMPTRKIAQGIRDREADEGVKRRVLPGPADTEIFNKLSDRSGRSPSDDFEAEGVVWERAEKSPGSRKRGWEMLRTRLLNSVPTFEGYREEPGLFVCDRNVHWLEHVPPMPRDITDPDDVPEKYEDHLCDMTRYRLNWELPGMWRKGF